MARWLIMFGVFVVFGSLFWRWLRDLGLARLPGDMVVDFIPGVEFPVPMATALLLSGLIAGAWSLLDR